MNTYLREEIKEEALVQNFIHFSRFLKVAAFSNAGQLNYANISRDTGIEVDFLIGRTSAVEVKAASKIQEKHLKGLRMLREEGIVQNFYLVCLDETDRQTSDGIRVLHWKSFLDQLWNNELNI